MCVCIYVELNCPDPPVVPSSTSSGDHLRRRYTCSDENIFLSSQNIINITCSQEEVWTIGDSNGISLWYYFLQGCTGRLKDLIYGLSPNFKNINN